MITVIGATGTSGGEVVRQLVDAGASVRAMVRNPEKAGRLLSQGVELVKGDLSDAPSVEAALTGSSHAFLVAAVDPRYVRWFQTFLTAARAAGRPHVVKFSAFGADAASPSEILRQHGETDDALRASGVPWTILRPNAFYQNLLWSAGSIKSQGAIYLPIGDAKQSLVDVRDIAAVAVKTLTEPGHEGKVYDITGPESLSYHDVAATFASVLGKPVQYVSVAPEQAKAGMLAAGMPEWNAQAVAELYGVFATGESARTTDAVRRVTGREPIALEQFVREHAAAFQ